MSSYATTDDINTLSNNLMQLMQATKELAEVVKQTAARLVELEREVTSIKEKL